jgi:hypothetical protein
MRRLSRSGKIRTTGIVPTLQPMTASRTKRAKPSGGRRPARATEQTLSHVGLFFVNGDFAPILEVGRSGTVALRDRLDLIATAVQVGWRHGVAKRCSASRYGFWSALSPTSLHSKS